MEKEQAADIIRGSSLSRHADLLIGQLAPSARLIVEDEPTNHGGGSLLSHLGGLPSLPACATWPTWDKRDFLTGQISRREERFKKHPRATFLRDVIARMREELARQPQPLPFVAQLSLAELHSTAPLPGWPSDGTLAFFCDPIAWGFDPLDRGHCRVLFLPAREKVAPVDAPKELTVDARYLGRKVTFAREWTLPSRVRTDGGSLSVWDKDHEYRDLCRLLRVPTLSDDEPIHRCGGHPQEIQGEMRLECQLVTNGLFCGDPSGYRDPRVPTLEKGAVDWQLLLQIDSDEKRLGWMWGDVGRIYFWARQQDIEAANFDGSWAILQCH
jgi:uncharacterized protein YwqG